MTRRGFLKRGVVVGMAGALLGAGSKPAVAQALPGGVQAVPVEVSTPRDWPKIPAQYVVENADVQIASSVRMVPGYDWSGVGDDESPRIDLTYEAWLMVTIDGESFNVPMWKPQEV